jgi:plastocyanin
MYMSYNPSVIVIRAGDTVVWKALDGPHTVSSVNVTADGQRLFDSQPKVPFPLPAFLFGPGGLIPPGGTYTLDTSTLSPGTYDIVCTIHTDEGMKATLTVTNETAPLGSQFNVVTGYGSVTNDMDQFVPGNITVPQGTKVNFVNLSSIEAHSVASLVTLSNGTKVVGTLFDSSPIFTPPGTSLDNLPNVNMAGVQELGGAMFPIPGMDTFSYTFNDPGTYMYFCKYHSQVENGNVAGMVGEVVVLPAYGTSSDIADLNTQFSQFGGQIATATTLAAAGIILGIVGIGLAVWARQRKPQQTEPSAK